MLSCYNIMEPFIQSSGDGVTVCDYNDVMINLNNTHYVHICRGQVKPIQQKY